MHQRHFPPYEAVPVARAEVLLRHPQVRRALEKLRAASRRPTQAMNYDADARHENPADIARHFLNGS